MRIAMVQVLTDMMRMTIMMAESTNSSGHVTLIAMASKITLMMTTIMMGCQIFKIVTPTMRLYPPQWVTQAS